MTTTEREDVWSPLRRAVGEEHCGAFMFVYIATTPHLTSIFLYKHRRTRHYLNLDDDGNAYRYDGETRTYEPIDRDAAIRWVFE